MLFSCVVVVALLQLAISAQLRLERRPGGLSSADRRSGSWDLFEELDQWVTEKMAVRPGSNLYHPGPGTKICEQGVHHFTEDDCTIFDDDKRCALARSSTTFLASFPCSGNTWARVLIDQVTGIYTGSVYSDQTLQAIGMMGEGHVNPSDVVAVKTHYPAVSPSKPSLTNSLPASRAIVLMRSPLEASLSYTSYAYLYEHNLPMPHAAELDQDTLRKLFDLKRDKYLSMWKNFTRYWFGEERERLYKGQTLILRFEDLVSDTSNMLTTVVLPYLGISSLKVIDRLDCAVTATIPHTQRNHSYPFIFTDADKQAVKRIIGEDVLKHTGYALDA